MSYDRRQELIDKHVSKPGLRGKIDAHCISCVYERSNGGTWRQQVEQCCVPSCPLYSVRAMSKPHGVGQEGQSTEVSE